MTIGIQYISGSNIICQTCLDNSARDLNELIGKVITYQSTTSSSGASRAVCVHYPSTREHGAAFRAWPSVTEMLLLHMSDQASFIQPIPAAVPETRESWSLTGPVDSFQVRGNVISLN